MAEIARLMIASISVMPRRRVSSRLSPLVVRRPGFMFKAFIKLTFRRFTWSPFHLVTPSPTSRRGDFSVGAGERRVVTAKGHAGRIVRRTRAGDNDVRRTAQAHRHVLHADHAALHRAAGVAAHGDLAGDDAAVHRAEVAGEAGG